MKLCAKQELPKYAFYVVLIILVQALFFYLGLNSIVIEQDMEERIRASRCHAWGENMPTWAYNYCSDLKY